MVTPLQLNGKNYSLNSYSTQYAQKEVNEQVRCKWYEAPVHEVGTVIDAGANIGLYSLYMSESAKTIYAIEPYSKSYAYLAQNIKDNKKTNIKPFNIALSGISGNRTMYASFHPDDPAGYSLLAMGNKLETVKSKTLAEFMKEEKIDVVHILKTDIEGLEQEVFSADDFGDVASKILCIVGEFHLQCPNLKDVLDYHGFDYIQKSNGLFTATRKVKKADLISPHE
jgi:FkbM family methyltransferase